MSNCEYLGMLEEGPDGKIYVHRAVIPRAPRRNRREIAVPPAVARQIEAGRSFLADILRLRIVQPAPSRSLVAGDGRVGRPMVDGTPVPILSAPQ